MAEDRSGPTPAEKELEEAMGRASEKRTQIETRTEELKKSFADADKELLAKEKSIEASVGRANEAIKSMRDTATTSVATIESGVATVSDQLDGAFAELREVSRYAPVFVLVVYYALYVSQYGLSYEPIVFGGVIVAAAIAALYKVILDRVYLDLRAREKQAATTIKNANKGLGGFLTTQLAIEPNLKRVKSSFTAAVGYGQVVLSSMRDFVPELEKVYNNRERMNRQLIFLKSLRNALTVYGFDLPPAANDKLAHFGPLTNTEGEWLDDITFELKPILGVSQPILKMIYSDYTGDDETMKNIWRDIVSKPKVLSELAKLLISNKLVATQYIETNVETYGAIEDLIKEDKQFDLNSFREKYNTYYVDFANEKKTAIDAVREYGIKVSSSTEQRVLKLTPPVFAEDKRMAALFEFISEQLGVPLEITRLSYFEREAELVKRAQAWNAVKRRAAVVNKLVEILDNSGIIEVPSQFKSDVAGTTAFVATLLQAGDDFTLASAKRKIQLTFASLESEKETFLRLMANRIILAESQRREFAEWLTTDVSPENIAKWLQDRTEVPDYILLLLYYDYVQDKKERQKQFGSMKEPKKMQKLAEILIQRRFIPTSEVSNEKESILNLSLLLMSVHDYDRAEIQAKFSTYNFLLNFSNDLLTFLREQQIIVKDVDSQVGDVIEAIGLGETGQLRQEEFILQRLLEAHGPKEFNTVGWLKPITYATLALYLVTRENVLSRPACKTAGTNDRATRILYQYSRVNEEDEQRGTPDRTPFAEVIRKTTDGSYTNFKYLVPFKDRLSDGSLYHRISDLLHARLDLVRKEVGDKTRLEKIVKKYSVATNTFLQSKLKANVILESLRMQLIGAYVITKTSAGAVMTEIIDEELPDACKELSAHNSVYKNLILLSKDTLGSSTRIGIVPFQMDFETFSKHFETAFRLAIQKHIARGGSRHATDFSGNILRIFPSNAYFRQVEGEPHPRDDLSESHPAQIIRDLVLLHYGEIANLELVASMQGETENIVAMRSMLTTFFDADTSIYLMAETEISGILATSQFLDFMKTIQFDTDLWTSFGCHTRSQLALTIYDSSGEEGKDADTIRGNIQTELTRLVGQNGAHLNDGQIESLSGAVYQVLYDIGWLLRGFPSN